MLEDSHGGLWLAGCEVGAEGFFYFDGSRFLSPLQAPFPKVVVSGMEQDSNGGIWIASSGGLYRFYQGQLEKLLDGVAMAGIIKAAPDVFLATVASAGHDASSDADLIRIARIQGQWSVQPVIKSVPQVQLRLDALGNLLYACQGGYCELQSAEVAQWRPGLVLPVSMHKARPVGGDGAPPVVWKDRYGCIWMRGRNDASYQCPEDALPVILPESTVSVGTPQIIELKDGSIVLSDFGKIAIGRPGKFRVLTMRNGYPSAGTVLSSKDGNILISNANGLFLMPLHVPMEFWSQRDGLDGNTWSVLRLKNRLFAVSGDAIFVLSRDRSRWLRYAKLRSATHLISGPNGTLLAGSHTEGAVQFSPAGTLLRRSPAADINMLAQTPDGRFWASGSGIFQIVFRKGSLKLQPANLSGPQGNGTDLKVDEKGGLWACYAGGLAHLADKDAIAWQRLSKDDGLLENGCASFAVEPGGNIWCSYNSVSSSSLINDPAGPSRQFKHFQNGEGLAAPQSHFLNFDRRNWLWRGGADGIYVADRQQARQGQWLHLGRMDGLPAVDTNQKSFFEDADGSLWFGIDSSIAHIFPPDDLIHPDYAPSVFIASLSWEGSPFRMAATVDKVASGTDMTAHIGSLQFDRRGALRLRYRLFPEQADWLTAEGMDIRLGKLRWGRHTLEVQAQLGDGSWSLATTKSFVVLKPLWLSWQALTVYFIAISFASIAMLRWRKKRQERIAKALPELAEWRLAALSPEVRRLEGTVLDARFEVGRVLARGGFATVAEGVDLLKGRAPCAIKIFRQQLVNKDWMKRRFQQEVLALEQMRHPHVVGIWGHGTTPEGAPYLVMEYVDGRTLRETIDAGSLARSSAMSYVRQTASALAEIHTRGIFHRDLKPENLMIRRDAPVGREIVLIDFSIAIVKDPDETLHGISRAAGTMYYMAPEQVIGYADASTDIHSLAKLVIEMLTGKRLSELLPDAALDLPARVREFLSRASLGLSASAIDCLCAALEFDPSRRPHDANEFADTVTRDWQYIASHAISGRL